MLLDSVYCFFKSICVMGLGNTLKHQIYLPVSRVKSFPEHPSHFTE